MKLKIFKHIIISFSVIFLIPLCLIKLSPPMWGMVLAIIILLLINPIYFIASPWIFPSKSKDIFFISIIDITLFVIFTATILNNSAYEYLYTYIPLSCLSAIVKFLYKKRSNS